MEDIDFSEVDDDLKKFQQDHIVKDALERGVDLGNYARQIEAQLTETERASLEDYLKQSADVAGLHSSIKSCDSVLESMEAMLTRFQSDLGAISSEIKHLQDKSMSMRVKLKNRKGVHKELDGYVKSIFLSPELVSSIHESEIKEKYISYLEELEVKIRYLGKLKKEHKLDKAAAEMVPLCERTKMKAVSRIRTFLVQKIFLLKKPQTNIQIKQNLLLRYKYLYKFLLMHSKDTAEEVKRVYVETIRKLYTAHFKQYLVNLMKLQAFSVVTKGDLLGVDESKTGGMFSLRRTKLHLERVFMLGNRDAILNNIDKPPIIYHAAAKRGHKFPYQEIFRTTHRLLMDTTTTETAFIADFFQPLDSSKDTKAAAKEENAIFENIFGKTIYSYIENLEGYLGRSYDCLELLILVRIVVLHQQMMRHRQTECLDHFFDRVNMLLWPRFKIVLDSHLSSIKGIKVSSVSRGNVSPHYLSKRYAEFAAGIDILNIAYQDNIITSNMARVRSAVCGLLEGMSKRVGDSKQENVFLINNYDTILKVFHDKNLSSETENKFKGLMQDRVAKYVEMELTERFGPLIEFVRRAEEQVAKSVDSKTKMPTLDLDKAAEIVRGFARGWQRRVEDIDRVVKAHFKPQQNEVNYKASEILKQILIQLVLYYQRLQDVIKKCYRRPPTFMKELVPIPTIMHEIKKYK
eukprot:CAMPEP_0197515828 /NCGR_PEP_ID=MMETSP1318-20131121/826_1 /TAXON_ID=552666 /ORGANISM="Partenskyella glossopodia, Strain RCC365" /LENGTH=688 /DNA_ID=CAMNT_0043064293 /DNA_START=96 /DNA_END=2162 /DNA_ORIENTATION=-